MNWVVCGLEKIGKVNRDCGRSGMMGSGDGLWSSFMQCFGEINKGGCLWLKATDSGIEVHCGAGHTANQVEGLIGVLITIS